MTREQTFLGYHLEAARRTEPTLECPIRLARSVLERIGVTLPENEFKVFATDLSVYPRNATETSSGAEAMK